MMIRRIRSARKECEHRQAILYAVVREALDAGDDPARVADVAGFGSVATMYRKLRAHGLTYGRWGAER